MEAHGECVRAWDEVCVCVGAAPARGRWQPRVEYVWNKWVYVRKGLKFCLGAGASSNRVVAEAVLSVLLIWFQPREASDDV